MGNVVVPEGTALSGPYFGLSPFTPYTVTNLSGTEQAPYAKEYMYDGSQDMTFRATYLAAGVSFVLNLASAPSVGSMIYIGNANFDKVFIAGRLSPTGGNEWTLTKSIYRDTRTGVRKMWDVLESFDEQYLFIRMEGSDNGGQVDPPGTYFEIGEIVLVSPALVVNFSLGHTLPIDPTTWRPREVIERRGGGVASVVNLSGRRRCRIDWSDQPILITDEEKFNQIVCMDEDQKFIFAENLATPATPTRTDDRSRVYLVRRIGDHNSTFAGEILEAGLLMEEV